jgi:hypothetical protein
MTDIKLQSQITDELQDQIAYAIWNHVGYSLVNQVFNEMGELNNNTLWSQVTARVDDNITVIPINFDGNL